MTYELQQGTPLQPANQSYQSYNLTGNLQLSWPFSFLAAENVVANIMDFVSDGAYTVTLPNATEASTGQSFIFNNLSLFTITLTTYGNSTPYTIPAGQRWYFYLTDNSTVDGVWNHVVYGTGTSNPDANALAGLGLISLPELSPPNLNVLNTNVVTSIKSVNFAPAKVDRASLILIPDTGTLTNIELNTNVLDNGFYFTVLNEGSTPFTITATGGTINGSNQPLPVDVGGYFTLVLQSANTWNVYGNDSIQNKRITALSLNVSGGDKYLTTVQAVNEIIILTGTLTADTTIYFPFQTDQWTIYNQVQTDTFALLLQAYSPPNTPVGDTITLFHQEKLIVICSSALASLVQATSFEPVVSGVNAPAGDDTHPSIQVGTTSPQSPSNTGLFYGTSPNPYLGFSVNGTAAATLDATGKLLVNAVQAEATTTGAPGFVGNNVPLNILTAPLGAAVVNTLVSSLNQASFGGLSILQAVVTTNSTKSTGNVSTSVFTPQNIVITNPNSRVLVIGIVYGAAALTSQPSLYLNRSPALTPVASPALCQWAHLGSNNLMIANPIFWWDAQVATPGTYRYGVTIVGGSWSLNQPITPSLGVDPTSFLVLLEIGGLS